MKPTGPVLCGGTVKGVFEGAAEVVWIAEAAFPADLFDGGTGVQQEVEGLSHPKGFGQASRRLAGFSQKELTQSVFGIAEFRGDGFQRGVLPVLPAHRRERNGDL